MGASLLVSLGGPFQPALAPGAGRMMDHLWPDPQKLITNPPATAICSRPVREDGVGALQVTGVGAPPAMAVGQYLGVACATQVITLGNFITFRMDTATILTKTSRQPLAGADDFQCYRLAFMLASTGPMGSSVVDAGCGVIQAGGTNQGIFANAGAGFQFRFLQAGQLNWTVRGPNGLVETVLFAAGFDITQWHLFEIWLVSATATADAYLFALVDGQFMNLPTLQRSWAAGTNLPPQTQVAGRNSMVAFVNTNIAGAATFCTAQVRVIAAPTLPALF